MQNQPITVEKSTKTHDTHNNELFLVDSHTHLSYSELGSYQQESAEAVVEKAKSLGVKLFLDVILKKSQLKDALNFSSNRQDVFHSFGVHPCDVEQGGARAVPDEEELLNLFESNQQKLIALGETGLDFYRSNENKNLQITSFEIHAEVASRLNLPLVVHMRNSWEEVLQVLKNFKSRKDLKGVIHCFSEDAEVAKKFADLGFYISFSGILTFKNAKAVQEAAIILPLEQILVETDSPFLAPTPFRSQVNEPANVYYVAKHLALLKNIELSLVAAVTTENFKKLFGVPGLPS